MSKRASVVPTLSLQEHVEKMERQREQYEGKLAAERDRRYADLRAADERRYSDLRAADATAVAAALAAQEKASAAALVAQEKAIQKADLATEKRFDGVNEFRGALTDATGKQVPREEYAAGLLNLGTKIDDLKQGSDRGYGRSAGALDQRTLMLSLLGLGFIVLNFLIANHVI